MHNIYEEKIHSFIILAIVMFLLGHALITSTTFILVLVFCLQLFLLVYSKKIECKLILKIILGSFLFSSFTTFFILTAPSAKYVGSESISFLGLNIYKDLFYSQLLVFYRVAILSYVSFSTMKIINFEKVFIFLMQTGHLSKRLGYPLILSINSMAKIKEEFKKIRINAKLRGVGLLGQWNIFLPLLVYAIRHGDRGAQSLVTRGLSEDKVFYFHFDIDLRSRLIFYFVFLVLLVCDIFLLTYY